jgi:Beta-ketoacyl synthase, N-terminal domain
MSTPTQAVLELTGLAQAAGLTVLAEARWPDGLDDPKPRPLAGFITSSFSPLVAEVADRCLSRHYGHPPAGRGLQTALVIVSATGDLTTAVEVANAVDQNTRVAPLLFFQAVPNAVAGHIAARWGIGGPVLCLSPAEGQHADAVSVVAGLIGDGDADDALVIFAEQATTDHDRDLANAVLVSTGHADTKESTP